MLGSEDRMTNPGTRAIFGEIGTVTGFHETERDIWGPFVWTGKRFRIRLGNERTHLAARLCWYGDGQSMEIRASGGGTTSLNLVRGWNTYPIDLTGLQGDELEFEMDRLIDIPEDSRELGVMIRWIRPVTGGVTPESLTDVLRNKTLNEREFARARIELESFPSMLRISTATRCSMDPCCVYCDWDRTKESESQSDFSLNLSNLRELGRFYTLSEEIVDNSYGEPFLYPEFVDFVDEFDRAYKRFEIGTNGFLLGQANRKRLLGKDVTLYVSADASTAEGFNRYRDADFNKLVGYLRDLCRERKEHHDLPRIIMSYVAMKSNVDDLGPFLDLMKDVGVDGTKVIYLDPDPHLEQRVVRRNGYVFDYGAELLSWSELEHLKVRAEQLGREKQVVVINRMDFGAEEAAAGGPICSDPWKNIHVLNRGIVACLFSRNHPVAYWSERGDRTIEQFLLDIWNGEQYRKIRDALARGELPDLCRKSLSCPIVRKRMESS